MIQSGLFVENSTVAVLLISIEIGRGFKEEWQLNFLPQSQEVHMVYRGID